MTIKEFIKEAKLTIDSTLLITRPNANEWPEGTLHFQVKITCEKGKRSTPKGLRGTDTSEYVTDYSVGPGIVKNAFKGKLGKVLPYRPKLEDVLTSLQLDCSSALNADSFEDWCSEFGYDTDSRRAEQTYNACRKAVSEMRRLLGCDLFNKFMEVEEE